jgi:cysteine-rich repeat protein
MMAAVRCATMRPASCVLTTRPMTRTLFVLVCFDLLLSSSFCCFFFVTNCRILQLDICGDGIIVNGEQCDDNNTVNDYTDGCTNCSVDVGWRCFGQANSSCDRMCCSMSLYRSFVASCNDGYAVYSEACDPSVLSPESDPGCDFGCHVKAGYQCNISDPIRSVSSYCWGMMRSLCLIVTESPSRLWRWPGRAP